MDSMLGKALNLKDKLQKQLKEIDEFIELYKRLEVDTKSENIEAAQTNFISNESTKDVVEPTKVRASKRRVRGTSPAEIVPIIIDMMRVKGLPMTRTEVLEVLLKQGVEVGGEDKAKNVGTIMWRHDKDFINLSGRGYWLRNTPCKAIGYLPEDTGSEGGLI